MTTFSSCSVEVNYFCFKVLPTDAPTPTPAPTSAPTPAHADAEKNATTATISEARTGSYNGT